jgi:glycosyltransferase involved in cell wall biosynthesis
MTQHNPTPSSGDPLPVHFLTIVLNGMPFIQHHIEQMKQLPFEWHWHIVEGMAALRHDTAWSVPGGGQPPLEMQRNGLSIDGTSAYLDTLISQFPDRVNVYRRSDGALWDGKLEMVSTPLHFIRRECLIWEIDADELWTAGQFAAGRKLFLDNPGKTAAYYWCWFFVGPRLVICTRGGYGNNPSMEWLRTWRFRPGMRWASHEPPLLAEQISPDQWRDVASVDPFLHAQTEAAGLVFQHFAYTIAAQLEFKQKYYGYSRAVQRWRALQLEQQFPASLSLYFPWVQDVTLVARAEQVVDAPLIHLPEPSISPAIGWNGQVTEIPRPRIAIDGAFFQGYGGGIGRVWNELLNQWIASGFARHLVFLDRVGASPDLAGLKRYLMPPLNFGKIEYDRKLLQDVCDRFQIDLFMSTYYTAPIHTPSIFTLHDMIPENMGWNLSDPEWQMKHRHVRQARAIISVSESSKRDLMRFFPEIPAERVIVAHNAASAVFQPPSRDDIAAFAQKYGIKQPYFLIVGDFIDYKNKGLFFEALRHLPNPGGFDVVSTGGKPLIPEHAQRIVPGCNVYLLNLEDKELVLAYGGAVALIYPSLYEGFGMPILEAMSCGCPVITCNNSSIPEVAGDAVIYVSATDPFELAVAMLAVQEPARRQIMIARGLVRAKQFSWSDTAAKIQSLLLTIASQLPNPVR